MPKRHHILATAGHVDHGKSALIQALTGTHPDRLPEEKARGITIDLGFAHLELDDAAADTPHEGFSVGIVDVPGHEDFVKNMVAGVGSVDLALLVVAADDGWMPQTEEHLQILSYLGVRHAVVALTKADLADAPLEDMSDDIRQRLGGSPFAQAPIIPVSATQRQGLEALRQALRDVLSSMPRPADHGKPRLAVDRVFTLQGIGTIVTGTLSGGTFHKGQPALVQPTGLATRIRSLQSHNQEVTSSGPGTRTALNLTDVTVAGREGGSTRAVQRGDTISLPDAGAASAVLDVVVEKSSRLADSDEPAARPLKNGSRVRFHHGSGNWPARLRLLEQRMLGPGQRLLAQLRLEAPAYAFIGDRFILRDWTERWTLAGGVVLEPVSARRLVRSAAHRDMLGDRAAAVGDPAVLVRSLVHRDRAVAEKDLLRQAHLSDADIHAAVEHLAASGALQRIDGWVVEPAWWSSVMQDACGLIDATHRQHPERPGLDLNELKRHILRRLPSAEFFSVLVHDLARHGATKAGTVVRKTDHRPALPANLQAAGDTLRAALLVKPFEPPPKKELINLPQGAEVLRFFLENGEAIDLGGDTILAAASFTRATRMIRRHIEKTGGATASDLRQLLKTNRRVIIPLLERLDRERITLRQGDRRVLGPGS